MHARRPKIHLPSLALALAAALLPASGARADSYVMSPIQFCDFSVFETNTVPAAVAAQPAAAPPIVAVAGVVTDPVAQDWVTYQLQLGPKFFGAFGEPVDLTVSMVVQTDFTEFLVPEGLGIVAGAGPPVSATPGSLTVTIPDFMVDDEEKQWTVVQAFPAGSLDFELAAVLFNAEVELWFDFGSPCFLRVAKVEPDLVVSDASVDFGTVELGSETSDLVTLTNQGDGALVLGSIGLSGAPEFGLGSAPAPGTGLATGESVDVEVTFAPTAEPAVAGDLEIESNDPGGTATVELVGSGVDTDLSVMEILDETFDPAVEAGTLVGSGPGGSADGRLGALRNKLEAAGDLVDLGEIDAACDQLRDVARRVDGVSPPPDFVEGPAAAELAEAVDALREDLGCAEETLAVRTVAASSSPQAACGLGPDLAPLVGGLWLARRRRRGRRDQA